MGAIGAGYVQVVANVVQAPQAVLPSNSQQVSKGQPSAPLIVERHKPKSALCISSDKAPHQSSTSYWYTPWYTRMVCMVRMEGGEEKEECK